MSICSYDCFHCIYKDCIQNKMSSKDRKEIKERDKRYAYCSNGRSVVQSKKIKRKYK